MPGRNDGAADPLSQARRRAGARRRHAALRGPRSQAGPGPPLRPPAGAASPRPPPAPRAPALTVAEKLRPLPRSVANSSRGAPRAPSAAAMAAGWGLPGALPARSPQASTGPAGSRERCGQPPAAGLVVLQASARPVPEGPGSFRAADSAGCGRTAAAGLRRPPRSQVPLRARRGLPAPTRFPARAGRWASRPARALRRDPPFGFSVSRPRLAAHSRTVRAGLPPRRWG